MDVAERFFREKTMTSRRKNATQRWFRDLRKVTANLEVCLEDIDALGNAFPHDTDGSWLCDLSLARLELRQAVEHANAIQQAVGMQHALQKLEHDQALEVLH